jgi:hypothetical protein
MRLAALETQFTTSTGVGECEPALMVEAASARRTHATTKAVA